MKEPIFLKPIFQERIWGRTALRDVFEYDIPTERTGECWAISAHPNGPSVVAAGLFAGKTLAELWEQHRELFGGIAGRTFPLLTKILDASADLSVQVHPNDAYAREYEQEEFGKTECWYIIDCQEGAELIYGHTAQSKKEFTEKMEKGEWENLLRRVPIQPGDFFFVPSGTVHALCEGTLVLETQQSSDTTYRLYDYDRVDADGRIRELHVQKSIDVVTIPHEDASFQKTTAHRPGACVTRFVESECFTVEKWEITGKAQFEQDEPFMLVSVINGTGTLKTADSMYSLSKGAHLLLPYEFGTFELEGELTAIIGSVPKVLTNESNGGLTPTALTHESERLHDCQSA